MLSNTLALRAYERTVLKRTFGIPQAFASFEKKKSEGENFFGLKSLEHAERKWQQPEKKAYMQSSKAFCTQQ